MDEYTYALWLAATVTGVSVPGEYAPGTNPLDVIAGR